MKKHLSEMAGRPVDLVALEAAYTVLRGRLHSRDTLALGILTYLNVLHALPEPDPRRNDVADAMMYAFNAGVDIAKPGADKTTVPVRRTFPVPEGQVAERDAEGGATGDTRPVSTIDDYQLAALSTAVYPGKGKPLGLLYVALKIAGEAGEVADKVGKAIRDHQFAEPQVALKAGGEALVTLKDTMTTERREALKLELGDVLWYVAAAARELGFTLNEVAHANLEKLHDRAKRGALQGSGDDR